MANINPLVPVASTVTTPNIKTLVSFDGHSGANPYAGLVADSAGNLFGTTQPDVGVSDGYAFEIAKAASGYAGAPTPLASVSPTDGGNVYAGLVADAAGDLFGTTTGGGSSDKGRVFEIAKTANGYAGAAVTLASFDGTNGSHPYATLVTDAAGDLFGTTFDGGSGGVGTVFEVAKTRTGYATAPTTLVTFTGANGANPQAGLTVDAAGNLLGTTLNGGANGLGSVFEVAKTATGYAAAATTLVSFDGNYPVGTHPAGGLVADAAGNLYGTTAGPGPRDQGTVFEVAKAGGGYASSYVTLATFNGANGSTPNGNLILDAAGDVFGTTSAGGANGFGTVFEVAKTPPGTKSGATTLFSFGGANGSQPQSGLVADAVGNLFGTTSGGGAANHGTAFELGNAGFRPVVISGAVARQAVTYGGSATPFSTATVADVNPGNPVTVTVALSAAANGTLSNLGGGQYDATSGVYTDVGTPASVTTALRGLVFTAAPRADPSSPGATTTFTVTATDPAGVTATDATTTVDATKLVTLAGFTGGESSVSALVSDAAGNLFGTSSSGGAGTVFELARTATGFAATPTTLASFNASQSGFLDPAGVVLDAAGNIFGTTRVDGSTDGTVFEIAKSSGGYAGGPKTLARFTQADGSPANLAVDAAGNLFGTKSPGTANAATTLFKVAKSATGYAAAPTTVATFTAANGQQPLGRLTLDASGDVFGTAYGGGANFGGTVFEAVRGKAGYGALVTLASFKGIDGLGPTAGVVADAAGNLFGTTQLGGANNRGEVFEIARTATGYASAPTVLTSFTGTNGERPNGGVVIDAAGTLFGTTSVGGKNGLGTIFKLPEVGAGYAGAPTTLINFNGGNGNYPSASLVANGAGNLFGTTAAGGPGGNGTLFELKAAGFQTGDAAPNYVDGPLGGSAFLQGTPGQDVITAHGLGNTVLGYGGADTIDAGVGQAYVDVGDGNATVTLGGGQNVVVGGNGDNVVGGAPSGQTQVTLGNGSNSVTVGGQNDVILLGDGNNVVGGTQGMAFIATGSGDDTIVLGGGHNTVDAGGGTNTIAGGSGSDTFVLPYPGLGVDLITGFTETNGDILDLRGALSRTAWDHRPETLSNFVRVTNDNGNTTLSIPSVRSDPGAAIAVLSGSGNLGLSDLVSHHSLLTL